MFTVLAPTGPAPVIDKVWPSGTIAGQDFNVQPGGRSAVGIRGSNFMPGAKVLFANPDGKLSQPQTFPVTFPVTARR